MHQALHDATQTAVAFDVPTRGRSECALGSHVYFMSTEIDFPVVGNYVVDNKEQRTLADTNDWRTNVKLD